jgi:IclR family acetate operon transcriptional repressor
MANARRMTVHHKNRTDDGTAGWVAEQATVLSVDKALLIVELLMRDDGSWTAREIAAQMKINRTTVHRLLNALIHRGWIEKVDGTSGYRLGLRFLALAGVAVQTRDFVAEVRPTLERLSRLSRETVHLGVLDGFEVVHVDKVDSPEQVGVSSKIGTRAVPHVTGLGKALLAAGSEAYLAEYLAHARSLPVPYTVNDAAALRDDISLTRERGYSIDNEEASIGVRCLGVAVRGGGDEPVFAISLTGPSPRFTLERVSACVPDVLAAARSLSLQFGWRPAPAPQKRGTVELDDADGIKPSVTDARGRRG